MNSVVRGSLALAGLAWSGAASAAVVWECETRHSYDLVDAGALERYGNNIYVGDRFTVNDDTGEVVGPNLGDPQGWKKVARRFGPDQDGLQLLRFLGDKPLAQVYVQTFTVGPVKPFMISDLDTGGARTGTCRAKP